MPNLKLQVSAQRSFGFLMNELGFKCAESGPTRVRFESHKVFVEILFDGNRSYELGLFVGLRSEEHRRDLAFSLDEILRLRHPPTANRFSLVQVKSDEALEVWLSQFAEALRIHGAKILDGDEASFVMLEKQRRIETERYALERDLRQARVEAEDAWRRRDYADVVSVFGPVRNLLTKAEIKKLEYAEKHTSQ